MTESCPFCNIAVNNPPGSFHDPESGSNLPTQDLDPTAHLILSTEHVLAFLDIMPLTRGHVLVAPRRHFEMLGDMDVQASQEVFLNFFSISHLGTKFPSHYLSKCFQRISTFD